mmetsp:Transcript_29872/g.48194  ORF Transcript_29872/g.48194 Transcript_29872/m.48194 type:complete len:209 (-) Transcript_29872:2165-2791(-)
MSLALHSKACRGFHSERCVSTVQEEHPSCPLPPPEKAYWMYRWTEQLLACARRCHGSSKPPVLFSSEAGAMENRRARQSERRHRSPSKTSSATLLFRRLASRHLQAATRRSAPAKKTLALQGLTDCNFLIFQSGQYLDAASWLDYCQRACWVADRARAVSIAGAQDNMHLSRYSHSCSDSNHRNHWHCEANYLGNIAMASFRRHGSVS